MKRRYEPSPLAETAVQPDGARSTLVFVRQLAHPPERVWQALTDPAELRAWSPFDSDLDLGKARHVTLTMAGTANPPRFAAEVRQADFPRLLEYTWDKDVLRWELEPTATGTRLTLRHTLSDRTWLPKVAAGWHICLDVADRHLAGTPIGRIVAEEAREYGWDRLNEAYADRLAIPSTGWPEPPSS